MDHHTNALFETRLGKQLTCLKMMKCVLKDPGVIESTTSDAHARAAGLIEHHFCCLRSGNIAIADYRNCTHCLRYSAYAGEVDDSAETLLPCAAMNENRSGTCVLERSRQLWSSDIIVIPAQAHLGRDRNLQNVHHSFDQLSGLIQFGHHGRAATDAADLPHRASHIDVHRGNANGFEVKRSITHFLWH